jgi:hypothetical protein
MNIKVKDTTTFILKSKLVHNDKYDYSLSKYLNTRTDVIIFCPEHGEFKQSARAHLQGKGCRLCSPNCKKNTTSFLKELKIKFGDTLDYSFVVYKTYKTPISLVCHKHGLFIKTPKYLMESKHACSKCSGVVPTTKSEFINQANLIHFDSYNYDNVNLNGSKRKVIITCKKHGDFEQTPNKHLSGNGCGSCVSSKGENLIENFFILHNIKYKREYNLLKNTFTGSWLRSDFFLPKYNLVLEYDGIQHFKPVPFFGGVKKLKMTQTNDNIKNKYCIENKIDFIRFKYNEKDSDVIKKLESIIQI